MKRISSKIYVGLVMVFLYLPIAVLILYSFNDGKPLYGRALRLNGIQSCSKIRRL